MDSVIELKCPQCGANLVYDPAHKKASCEYCGYEMLVKNEQAFRKEAEAQTEAEEGPKTLTEKMAQKTKLEQEQKRKQMAEADQNNASLNELARHLLNFGGGFRSFRWRVKNALWFLLWTGIAFVFAAVVCKYLPSMGVSGLSAYKTYQMVAGLVLSLAGIFSMVTSRHRMRGIPLGLGLGLLISYFMNFWG